MGHKIQTVFSDRIAIVGISWKLVESQTKPSEFQVTKRSLFNAAQSRSQDAKKKRLQKNNSFK